MNKKRKNLDLDEVVIKVISKQAIDADSNFKNMAEILLTKIAINSGDMNQHDKQRLIKEFVIDPLKISDHKKS